MVESALLTTCQDKRNISWNEFYEDLNNLAAILPKNKHVWGVPLNGLIIASLLCKIRKDLRLYIQNRPYNYCEGKNNLIILDDISDTGNTLKKYKSHGMLATIHLRHSSLVIPDYYVKKEDSDKYLIYPWEVSE
jgi:hypothetical protein